MSKLLTLSQGQELANAVIAKVAAKNYAVSATTLAGYGIEDAYTKSEVDGLIGATYRPAGTIAGTGLVAALLVEGNVGKVYNVSSQLNITAENEDMFLNLSAGDKVKAGDDVGIVEATVGGETVYLFNDFAGFIDLSGVTYTEGNGIDITNNVVSVDVDSTSANGLSTSANGLALATATTTAAGAMSAADKAKLDDADVTAYTAGNGADITNHVVSAVVDSSNANGLSVGDSGIALAAATSSTAGAMSAADKDKLDNADVTAYTAGNGIDITSHAVTAVVDGSNSNGLSVGSNGIALSTATASTAGAMSASDKDKLDNADVTAYTAGNGIDITSHAVTAVVDGSNANGLSVGSSGLAMATATTSAAGAMSAADKTKLDDYELASASDVDSAISGLDNL